MLATEGNNCENHKKRGNEKGGVENKDRYAAKSICKLALPLHRPMGHTIEAPQTGFI